MVVAMIRAALSRADGSGQGREGGMWHTIRTWIEGKNATTFERERRTTLLTAPSALQQGGRIYDQRSDGSILEITVPVKGRMGFIVGEPPVRDRAASEPAELLAARSAALPRAEER